MRLFVALLREGKQLAVGELQRRERRAIARVGPANIFDDLPLHLSQLVASADLLGLELIRCRAAGVEDGQRNGESGTDGPGLVALGMNADVAALQE